MMTSLPNLLTISRIIVIPAVVATFYVDDLAARWVACGLFVLAAITDFFDGWLARRRSQVSNFGRFLDPIADKLLVAAVLLMLAAFDRMHALTALASLVILLREILVSGLREFLAEIKVGMPVSKLAKWKTGVQMTALPVLLVGDKASGMPWLPVQLIGEALLWVAAALTLITGWDYVTAGLRHIRAHPTPNQPQAGTGTAPQGR